MHKAPTIHNNGISITIKEKIYRDIIVTSMTSHTIYSNSIASTAYLTWNQYELLHNIALAQDIPDFSCIFCRVGCMNN